MTATNGVVFGDPPLTRIASETITAGHAVKDSATSNTADLCDTAGEESMGMALNTAAAGESVAIQCAGTHDRAIAGAPIATINTPLMVNSSGRYIAATGGGSKVIVGWNLSAAAGDGSEFGIRFNQGGKLLA